MKRLLLSVITGVSILGAYGFLGSKSTVHVRQGGGETWTTATALKQLMSGGQLYWNGYVWGGWLSRYGLTVFDGNQTALAGKTLSAFVFRRSKPIFHPERNFRGLFFKPSCRCI